ncbi:uncharacterized protein LOC134765921 [Penaeus indicus]|uniref:uncharacterized protein LOC134765921 n=1 Tax=Penaeus indicus TaxID=29960 RepID=UPI00300CC031
MLYQASPLPPPSSPSPSAEEDLVDALFHACDASGCGRVPAAQIAAHLAVILSDLQPRWLVESLKDALCTDGEENQLDISTYRGLLTTWLQDHARDVNILNNHNTDADAEGDAEGDADADTSCDEVTDIFASPKPNLSEQETQTPVNVVTPTRPSNTPRDLTTNPTAAYALNATPLFVPTPVNRTQDSFAWCGTLRDLGDGGEMGRTPPRRQLLYEDRLRQCIEGQFSSGNSISLRDDGNFCRITISPELKPSVSAVPLTSTEVAIIAQKRRRLILWCRGRGRMRHVNALFFSVSHFQPGEQDTGCLTKKRNDERLNGEPYNYMISI